MDEKEVVEKRNKTTIKSYFVCKKEIREIGFSFFYGLGSYIKYKNLIYILIFIPMVSYEELMYSRVGSMYEDFHRGIVIIIILLIITNILLGILLYKVR